MKFILPNKLVRKTRAFRNNNLGVIQAHCYIASLTFCLREGTSTPTCSEAECGGTDNLASSRLSKNRGCTTAYRVERGGVVSSSPGHVRLTAHSPGAGILARYADTRYTLIHPAERRGCMRAERHRVKPPRNGLNHGETFRGMLLNRQNTCLKNL